MELGLIVAGLMVVSAVGMITTFKVMEVRKRRVLVALPPTKIGELIDGRRARVIGTARKLGEDVGAPYSGTVCLACHSWVSLGGDGSTPDDIDRVVAFRVEDETGTIEVGVGHVKLMLRGESVALDRDKHVFGAGIIAREAGSGAGGAVTFWEDRLAPDERVAVIGVVERTADGGRRLVGLPQRPLVISNYDEAFRD